MDPIFQSFISLLLLYYRDCECLRIHYIVDNVFHSITETDLNYGL